MFTAKLGHVLGMTVGDVDEHDGRLSAGVRAERHVRRVDDVVATSLQLNALTSLELAKLGVTK